MTTDQHLKATYAYVGALVDALALSGVRHACLCPGSRSTPLALTLAAHPAIKLWMHVDERSCAFFALGLAKASATPVAIACTSGTAAANFYPAVIEARYGRVPLVVLTADRPPELRENGAPQAIDQLNLYGRHAKWFMEMAVPEGGEPMLRYARATVARAVATAGEAPAGPVHLNLPFREPFVPFVPRDRDEPDPFSSLRAALPPEAGRHMYQVIGDLPVMKGSRAASERDVANVADLLRQTERGLIVCGPQSDPGLADAVTELAAALSYPVLADPLSGIRCGTRDRALICDAYDALLHALPDDGIDALAPDVVVRFGAVPTSKGLLTFLNHTALHVLVDGDGGWQDPSARANIVVHADAVKLCKALSAHLVKVGHTPARAWLESWHSANLRARASVQAYLEWLGEPFEGKVFAELAVLLPLGTVLYVGNSMPVRDLDTFFPGSSRYVRFLCNRGANGIDGVVSSALGAAAHVASGGEGQGPLVLVIGDLSFYHDMNGLLAAKQHKLDATIILLNNDGGGIFSFLPQAAGVEGFEQLFGTPTGLDFAPVARMYGCEFETVASWPAFRQAVSASLSAPGVQIVELRTDRDRNVVLHREVWKAVKEAL